MSIVVGVALAVGIAAVTPNSGFDFETSNSLIDKIGSVFINVPFAPAIPLILAVVYMLINPLTREGIFNRNGLKELNGVAMNELLEGFSRSANIDLDYDNQSKLDSDVKSIMENEAFERYKNYIKFKKQSVLSGEIHDRGIEIQNIHAYYMSKTSESSNKTKRVSVFNGAVHIAELPVNSDFYMRAVPRTSVSDNMFRTGLKVGGIDLGNVPLYKRKSTHESRKYSLEQSPDNRSHNYVVETNDESVANMIITPELSAHLSQNVAKEISASMGKGGFMGGIGDVIKNREHLADSIKSVYNDVTEGNTDSLSTATQIEALIVKNGVLYVFFEAPLTRVKRGNKNDSHDSLPFDITKAPGMSPDYIWWDIEDLYERSNIVLDIIESLE